MPHSDSTRPAPADVTVAALAMVEAARTRSYFAIQAAFLANAPLSVGNSLADVPLLAAIAAAAVRLDPMALGRIADKLLRLNPDDKDAADLAYNASVLYAAIRAAGEAHP